MHLVQESLLEDKSMLGDLEPLLEGSNLVKGWYEDKWTHGPNCFSEQQRVDLQDKISNVLNTPILPLNCQYSSFEAQYHQPNQSSTLL